MIHASGSPFYALEWSQDRSERVMRITGVIDFAAAEHLFNGLIDLGSRRLVIDLTDAQTVDLTAIEALSEIEKRLGPGRLTVLGPHH
ncbi:MAG TPA: STAS domain-containing protein [Acidimicrobiia bacterium]|nr:STAS domain-containing protein [Acidimicrobiia bacterium]